MFDFRQKNRRRRTAGQQVRSLGERITGLGRKILPVIFLVAVGVGVPFGIFQAYLKTVSGEYFELSKIEISGLKHLESAPLMQKAGVIAGRNIFDVDLEQADRIISANAWVKSATVERRLPDQIRVTITEYEPVAVLVGERYQLVSRDGVVFETLEPGEPLGDFLALPLISGLEVTPGASDKKHQLADITLFFEVLDVVHLYEEMGLSNWEPLSEIHIDPTLGLTLVSADTGVEIRLGRGQYRKRLERLKVVQQSIAQRAMEVDYILIDQESDLSRVAVGRRHGPRMGPQGQTWED